MPAYDTQNAYQKEEFLFERTVKEVYTSKVPQDANIITSNVLYKFKVLYDESNMVRARTAPHGKKGDEKYFLKTDSQTCPPVVIRIPLSIGSILKLCLAKIDVKSAFLQKGTAMRDVYVVPPRECSSRSVYWLLLTAEYLLVNSNAKFQNHRNNYMKLLSSI